MPPILPLPLLRHQICSFPNKSTWEPAANLPVDYIDTFELSLKTRALTPSPVSALAEEEGMELFASCHNALCAKIESRPAAVRTFLSPGPIDNWHTDKQRSFCFVTSGLTTFLLAVQAMRWLCSPV